MKTLKILILGSVLAGCVTKAELREIQEKNNKHFIELYKKACQQEVSWCIVGSGMSWNPALVVKKCKENFMLCTKRAQDGFK